MATTEQVTDVVRTSLQRSMDEPRDGVRQQAEVKVSFAPLASSRGIAATESSEPPIQTFQCDGCDKRFAPTEITRYRKPRMLICNTCKPRMAAIINELAPFDFDDAAQHRVHREELFESAEERFHSHGNY